MIYFIGLIGLLILLIILVVWVLGTDNLTDKSPWIDTDSYPAINKVYQKRSDIRTELNSLIEQDIWTVWRNEYEKTPIFTKMTREDILKKINSGNNNVNTDTKSWKLYGLYLQGQPIDDNLKRCPQTAKILKEVPGLINAGFSVLEPKSKTELHRDYDKSFYRAHIPLKIPEGDCALQVNGYTRRWADSEFFIFDDPLEHEAWNNTNEIRIILIVDIAR